MIEKDINEDFFWENHISTNFENPIRKDAFYLSDEAKIESIKKNI